MRRFKTFDDYESKPAKIFDTPESRERFAKAMKESVRQSKLNHARAVESAKKIWVR